MAQILESPTTGDHREPVDEQPHRFRRFRWWSRGRRAGESLPQVGEIQTSVAPDHGTDQRPLQHDLVKARAESPQTDDLEVDVQSAERQHRLAVTVGKRQIGDIERERVRVEADLTQRKFALVVRADEIGQTRAQEMRNRPKPRHRIQRNEENHDGERYDVALCRTRKHWPPLSRAGVP